MTINRQQLTKLLVEKSGLEKEQVEKQLSEFIKQIRNTAKEGKSFEVEEFGTFSIKDDEIRFSPAERLETEINNKYAGMKPIELIGAFKEPGAGKIPDMEQKSEQDDAIWAFDQKTERTEKEEEAGEKTKEKSPDKIEEIIEPSASNKAQQAFEKLVSRDDQEYASQASPGVPEEPEKEQRAESSAVKEKEEAEEQDPIGRVLAAAVVLIAVAIAGLLVYDAGFWSADNSTGKSVVSTNDSSVQPQKSAVREDKPVQTASAGESSEPEQSNEVINSSTGSKNAEQSKPDTQQQETFGLKGMVNSQVGDGYTIVIHSLRDQKLAESRKQNFANDGYRALINEAEVDGTTYYRVGLGQFATISAAQEAVSNIPAQFQDQSMHFIKRIQ